MGDLVAVLFPIYPVELTYFDPLDRAGFETAHVDAVAVGIGARHIKGFDAANFTKEMLGDAGVEFIFGEELRTL